MTDNVEDLHEFHWLMDMLATIEVGLVVLDSDYHIQVWNSFMENHSGKSANRLRDQELFSVFPDLPESWLRRKVELVRTLNTRAFTSWEQRPYLFRFHNTRPITGMEPYMFQNITFCPLTGSDGKVSHVCMVIYDVTDAATSRRQLERANSQLSDLSRTDQLTGLLNRGTWEAILTSEFERYRRYQGHCCVIMFDIDHFKAFNDTYGHQAGDDVLRSLSLLIQQNLRQTDIAGRYGGEEFGIILPETDDRGAIVFAERLRKAVANNPIDTGSETLFCTISIGISLLSPDTPDYLTWLSESDQALYQSKEGGRNMVTLWQG